jgi:hypothetical protein
MADKTISALTGASTPLAGTEVLPIVQGGSTVKATVANIVGAGTSPGSFTNITGSANAIISVTDNTNAALRITQLGTGNALLVEDSTNPDASPFVINAAGRVGIGTSSPNTILEVSSLTGSASPIPTEVRVSTTTNASDWSTTLPWAQLGFYSADPSSVGPKLHASIAVISDIANGGTSSLNFNTSDNTGALLQRMRISSTGLVSVTGTFSTTLDATINGQTVGKGAGNIVTNTAHGTSALAANTTASNNTAVGYQSLTANTASRNTAVGYSAGSANTTGHVTALGAFVLTTNTTGSGNTGIGGNDEALGAALQSNTTGSYNTAVGTNALGSNTTVNSNTAVGYSAAGGNTTGTIDAFGYQTGLLNTTGTANAAFGAYASRNNLTGASNSAFGNGALSANTASNSTAVGYQAGYLSTGAGNQLFGYSSGSAITTGAKNVILGSYTGSAAPISATGSNYIVLSDGDGNVRQYFTGANATFNGTITPQQADTASAPTYVKGSMYFDTTLNKLRIGGATGWETVTSV